MYSRNLLEKLSL